MLRLSERLRSWAEAQAKQLELLYNQLGLLGCTSTSSFLSLVVMASNLLAMASNLVASCY